MAYFSCNKEAEIIQAFNCTSIYLDNLLNIDKSYFEGMLGRSYPPDLYLNKAKASDTEASFLDLNLSFSNGFVSSNIYKRGEFDFDIVNFAFWTGTFPVIHLTVCTFLNLFDLLDVTNFNARNKILTDKLLHQGYRYHKLRKAFSKLYRRTILVSKFKVGLKSLLQQGLSESEFYGYLVYKLRKINVNRADLSDHFR